MGLKLIHDGSVAGDLQENCCLCRKATGWWFGTGALNVALCETCGATATAEDLPTKTEWMDKERRLAEAAARQYGHPFPRRGLAAAQKTPE